MNKALHIVTLLVGMVLGYLLAPAETVRTIVQYEEIQAPCYDEPIEVYNFCDLPEQDKEAFKRMGVEETCP
jgi:hypothetical protein